MKTDLEELVIKMIDDNKGMHRKHIVDRIFKSCPYSKDYVAKTIVNLVLDGTLNKLTHEGNRRKVYYEVVDNG